MLWLAFVIALVLPSFAVEGKETKNKNATFCTDPKVIKAGDEFFKCFHIHVNNSITHNNRSCSKPLSTTILHYISVTKKTCYNKTVSHGRDALEFYNLVQFSMKNDNLKDFAENGGLECIRAIKHKIRSCVTNVVANVKEVPNRYHTLWKESNLTIDIMSCTGADAIKICTLNEMRNEGYHKCQYENTIALHEYVSSLFDYMLNRCTSKKIPWQAEPTKPMKENNEQQKLRDDAHTTHVLLGLLLTLAILGLLYTVFRECCTPSGRWKTFNENIAMRQRSQSLVNNDACQEH